LFELGDSAVTPCDGDISERDVEGVFGWGWGRGGCGEVGWVGVVVMMMVMSMK